MRTVNEIIEFFRAEPAPLLPILHAIQEQEGRLTDDAIRQVAEALKIPHAELYGTITFYHFFNTAPATHETYRCNGPACSMNGPPTDDGAHEIPCPGRCDLPPSTSPLTLKGPPPPVPPANGAEECLFKNIRKPGRATIDGYRSDGGYRALEQCLKGDPRETIATIKASGLAGRGGAGFPTGAKWEMVAAEQRSPKYLVVNADEGEPGCFKDRALMEYDPHALIEGMAIAGRCVGAKTAIIYLRYEYPHCLPILEQAIREAKATGHLNHMTIHIRRGAGAYICGEETSLLNSLEGKRPFPREKPPFPTTHGFMNMPTVINNVETLCAVPPIILRGADWYRNLGRDGNAGTKIFSVSGDVRRPGNYELPLGTPLKQLIEAYCGGVTDGRRFQAATMAGISGGFVSSEQYAIPLDPKSLAATGSMLGAGGIIVYHDGRNMVEAARDCMKFFAAESCGKCFPCRIGCTRLTEMLDDVAHGKNRAGLEREIDDVCRVMTTMSACGLGQAAPNVVTSLNKYWRNGR